MRGPVIHQTAMLSAVTTEDLVPKDHPIRQIKPVVDAILVDFEPTFRRCTRSSVGSIPPEHLLKSTVLMAMYSVRSERQFCERLQYDMLFRWFLDMGIEDSVFVPTTFTKNRERLLTHEVADQSSGPPWSRRGCVATSRTSIHRRRQPARGMGLGQELQAPHRERPGWADSGGGAGRDPEVDFHGEKRSNATHQSTTEPEAC